VDSLDSSAPYWRPSLGGEAAIFGADPAELPVCVEVRGASHLGLVPERLGGESLRLDPVVPTGYLPVTVWKRTRRDSSPITVTDTVATTRKVLPLTAVPNTDRRLARINT